MFRNCPEHPVIRELIKNGEIYSHNDLIHVTGESERNRDELFEMDFLPEELFAELCRKRKKRKGS